MLRGAEYGRLIRVLVKHPRDAFASPQRIDAQWRDLNFTAAPDLPRALEEYERFLDLLQGGGAVLEFLPDTHAAGLDSIYTRDASIACGRGVILCNMGKPQRIGEPAAQASHFRALDMSIAGAIQPPGRVEGGDVAWLTPRIAAVGRGYRTNDDGIRQLGTLLAGDVDELITVPLPHWRGASDVFHLMSIVSPVDRDLAVVYAPLLPVPFRERLLDLGFQLVEVPDDEFESMGANVLAIAPRACVLVEGNPVTRRRLERAGATVLEYRGEEISRKGGGGPTCLTRPLDREGFPSPAGEVH